MGLVCDLLPRSFWTTGGDRDEYDPGGCGDSGRGVNGDGGSSKLAGRRGNDFGKDGMLKMGQGYNSDQDARTSPWGHLELVVGSKCKGDSEFESSRG